ncbi:DUF3017 domain-containing protein [Streptomyces sp. NBC_00654]|uniref:DUF3017 domain-containing protein n=1 Tax=Streptomyces sp. NBC_00654 TaxID=2975799 RepID=UPI002250D64C|nr:DUF3017 domain-containing protein [Streptomyces sp. NBC_00654]MCX4964354.1 DUF3017 domain-containing protein [Streptomyces sp. NBC_00654]
MGAGTSPAGADPAPAPDPASDPASVSVPGDRGPGERGEQPHEPHEPGEQGESGEQGGATAEEPGAGSTAPRRSRRFPSLTRDTARPEGGGRAASGDAPAPARQWPLLTVLCTAGAGLLIVAADPFAAAFRIGTILIGAALLTGAVLRWAVPSVGMLAVRSRFTDLVTYGLMGTLIVLLALMAQPKPWLDIPVLEDAVHFTIR